MLEKKINAGKSLSLEGVRDIIPSYRDFEMRIEFSDFLKMLSQLTDLDLIANMIFKYFKEYAKAKIQDFKRIQANTYLKYGDSRFTNLNSYYKESENSFDVFEDNYHPTYDRDYYFEVIEITFENKKKIEAGYITRGEAPEIFNILTTMLKLPIDLAIKHIKYTTESVVNDVREVEILKIKKHYKK